MNLVYSHRGFPVKVPKPQSINTVYESPELGPIYLERRRQDPPNFEKELEQIAAATKVWVMTGGLFVTALDPEARLNPSARSFIIETAKVLTQLSKRRVSFADWELLFDSDETKRQPPNWTDEERALLSQLSALLAENLIQRWITTLSVDDLIQTLFLYVGPLDANG